MTKARGRANLKVSSAWFLIVQTPQSSISPQPSRMKHVRIECIAEIYFFPQLID
jgi:hypothetical protein